MLCETNPLISPVSRILPYCSKTVSPHSAQTGFNSLWSRWATGVQETKPHHSAGLVSLPLDITVLSTCIRTYLHYNKSLHHIHRGFFQSELVQVICYYIRYYIYVIQTNFTDSLLLKAGLQKQAAIAFQRHVFTCAYHTYLPVRQSMWHQRNEDRSIIIYYCIVCICTECLTLFWRV